LFPSRKVKFNTELSAFPFDAGKAPERKSTDWTKSTLIIPTGPPEAPWVEKWFRYGISTLSM